MLQLPVDTSKMSFLAGGVPQEVIDYDTRRPRADRDGHIIFQVPIVILGDDGANVVNVKVTGEPKGIDKQTPVKITGLVATYWQMQDERTRALRSGMSYRAERIEALAPSRSTPAPAGAAS